MDEDQEEARAELIQNDARRAAVPVPEGVAASNAIAAAQQHLADALSGPARSAFLGLGQGLQPESDVLREVTPWPCYIVTEALTQETVDGDDALPTTTYFIKLRVSADGEPEEHVQLRACEDPFGGTPKLVSLRKGAAADEPLALLPPAPDGQPLTYYSYHPIPAGVGLLSPA